MSRSDGDQRWYDFLIDARPVFGLTSTKDTNKLVRYITTELKLKRGSSFLDCPCGIGQVAIPLAAQGIKVTGVDIMPSYLEEMKGKAERKGLPVTLVHADMRRIDFSNEFDAGGNLRTSFGYFEKESDNLRVLKRMLRALRPGGQFIMTVRNRDWIISTFAKKDWCEADKLKIVQERSIDYSKSVLTTDWHFIRNGREVVHTVSVRMYSYHELLRMMKVAGFVEVRGYGSYKNEKVSSNTETMIIIGNKPTV